MNNFVKKLTVVGVLFAVLGAAYSQRTESLETDISLSSTETLLIGRWLWSYENYKIEIIINDDRSAEIYTENTETNGKISYDGRWSATETEIRFLLMHRRFNDGALQFMAHGDALVHYELSGQNREAMQLEYVQMPEEMNSLGVRGSIYRRQ